MKWIKSIMVCVIASAIVMTGSAQTIHTVNTTDDNDDGNCNAAHCSLREAINASNADGTASEIHFAIPGTGPHRIFINSTLPDITAERTEIDATTQSGIPGEVIIDCSRITNDADNILDILGDRTELYGLEFSNYNPDPAGDKGHIINLGTPAIRPENCRIGAADKGNIFHSIDATPAFGVAIFSTRSKFTTIKGNRFGTNYAADQILPINGTAIYSTPIQDEGIYIGGSFDREGNIIGNCRFGIDLQGGYGWIRQNIVGTNDEFGTLNFSILFSGIRVVPSNFGINVGGPGVNDGNIVTNCRLGIDFQSGSNVTIERNTVFNNPNWGIFVASSQNLFVRNNEIYNNGNGIWLATTNSDNTTIATNTIHDNDFGIVVELFAGDQGKLITDNALWCNNTGIEVFDNGLNVAPPVITATSPTEIRGTSFANAIIEVYRQYNRGCESTACQGRYLLGTTTANGAGNWILPGTFTGGYDVTATATSSRDNTSEYSNCVPVTAVCNLIVTSIADNGPGTLREAITCANMSAGADFIEFNIPGPGPHTIQLVTPLPPLTDNATVIDGTSQPGNSPFAELVIIDGTNLSNANGITVEEADDIEIYGLVFQNFDFSGISTNTAGGGDCQFPDRGSSR